MSETMQSNKLVSLLREYYNRNGYIRNQNKKRLETEGAQEYKKGYEIRFTANSEKELQLILKSLKELNFKTGKPFPKDNRFCIPIYGCEQVQRLIILIGIDE